VTSENPFNDEHSIEYKSLETLKEVYKERLDSILNKQLTLDNIEIFAEEALNETIQLIDDLLQDYRNNPAFESNTQLDTKSQEDDACLKLGLPNLPEILDSIVSVKDKIEKLNQYITENVAKTDTVITTPNLVGPEIMPGEEGNKFERKVLFPRLLTLMYILQQDFEIKPEEVSIVEGDVTSEMVRQNPYYRVTVEELNRIVYICDEIGNASYVFDLEIIKEKGLNIDDIDVGSKDEKSALIAQYPGIGVRIIQSKHWRSNISTLLSGTIPSVATENGAELQAEQQPESEFKKENVKSLDFNTFQEQVRAEYNDEGDIQNWYKKEYKKHLGWPAAPYRKYKEKGWVGWPELVGKENKFKKEYPDFDDFKDEVMSFYQGEKDVKSWYENEYKKHPNWHSNPHVYYKDNGWEGYPELVGERNYQKKEYPSFSNFVTEVRSEYEGDANIKDWYRKVYKKHKNWPSAPDIEYRNSGWVGWSELVGKENPLKKEFLDFEDFRSEVRVIYPGGDVYAWYTKEQKNHKNWPAAPSREYMDSGWNSWSELVGKENHLEKEWLPFDDFKNEVMNLYPGKIGVHVWYTKEQKNHKNWPSNPHKIYKNRGWESWSHVVNKDKII